MRRACACILLAAAAIAAACGSSQNQDQSPPATADAATSETGAGSDAAGARDTNAPGDASARDDAGDAGGGQDAGSMGCPMLVVDAGPASQWAHVDTPGHLAYATLPKGERILDFSSAGYMGGGVAIPADPVKQTVTPSGGADDTPAIQAAIDAVSNLPATGGVRGAVLLAAGTFQLAGTLSISTSGVVLRGSGSGTGGTVLQVGGAPRTVITIDGTGSWTESSEAATITDAYVPSGTTSFHVDSTTGLSPGTPVLVDRPVTAAWIHFMGMDTLVRNDLPETWISAGSVIHADRTVTSVQGNTVVLDAPLSDTLDISTWGAGAPAPSVHTYTFAGRIEQVGLEHLRLIAPEQTVPISQPIFGILEMDAVKDAWVSDVAGEEFTTGFVVDGKAKSVTVQDSSVTRVAPIDGSEGYPFHFSIDGQGILVQRCTSSGIGVFSYVTQGETPGPNVVLGITVPESDAGSHDNLQPHQRWATGLLVDGANMPDDQLGLMNRGIDGSGHGWAIGFGVVWNGNANTLLIQQPPGTENWSIGAMGTQTTAAAPGGTAVLPQGIIDSQGINVAPRSLYLAQLCERLGPDALAAIGY